jgi:hypothetical protein
MAARVLHAAAALPASVPTPSRGGPDVDEAPALLTPKRARTTADDGDLPPLPAEPGDTHSDDEDNSDDDDEVGRRRRWRQQQQQQQQSGQGASGAGGDAMQQEEEEKEEEERQGAVGLAAEAAAEADGAPVDAAALRAHFGLVSTPHVLIHALASHQQARYASPGTWPMQSGPAPAHARA